MITDLVADLHARVVDLVWTYTGKKTGDDSIFSNRHKGLQWTPKGHRNRVRPTNTWIRDLEKEMWTASFIQLEEDGGGNTGQNWRETSSLWPMFRRE